MTIIKTDRLTIREFSLDDGPFILELLNDPDWLRFIGDKAVRTLMNHLTKTALTSVGMTHQIIYGKGSTKLWTYKTKWSSLPAAAPGSG